MFRRGDAYYYKAPGIYRKLASNLPDAIELYMKLEGIEPDAAADASGPLLSALAPSNWTKTLWQAAKVNAAARRLAFEITVADIQRMATQSEMKCMLTGLDFDFRDFRSTRRRPYVPSIDRIDCSAGYTPDNVRLVCACVNLAMNEWGLDVLLKMGSALKARGLI